MYNLTRVSLQNWYLASAKDINLRDSIAFIGPTGAGKSSIQDAIQTVICGGNHRRVNLNASASGATAGRKVIDYCLGYVVPKSDGGEPTREACETVIALTFSEERDNGSRHDICVGIVMTARKDDSREQIVTRFIAPGFAYSVEDFEVEEDGKSYMLSWDEIAKRIKERCPEFRDYRAGAERFVADMLAVMRYRGKQPDPRHFLHAFSNAVAFKPIFDPTLFVRSYILEPDPLDIERVRESIFAWRSISEAARVVQEKLDKLRGIRRSYEHWGRMEIGRVYDTIGLAAAATERARVVYAGAAKDMAEAEAEYQRQHTTRSVQEKTLLSVTTEVRAKRATLSEKGVDGKLAMIDTEQENARLKLSSVEKDGARLKQLFSAASNLTSIQGSLPRSFTPMVAAASAALSVINNTAGVAWVSHHRSDITRYLDEVRGLEKLKDRLEPVLDAKMGEQSDLRRERDGLQENLDRMKGGGSPLQKHTRTLIQLLQDAGIEATPLCDVVEVADERWQLAVEALLGLSREALIVDPGEVRRANEILYRNRNNFGLHRCRLVKTTDTRNIDVTVRRNSIAQVISTDNAHALAYIVVNIGGFDMVETEDELERARRAIMPNGKTTASMSYSVQKDVTPILGRAAQEQSAGAYRDELSKVTTKLAAVTKEIAGLRQAVTLAESIATFKIDLAEMAAAYDEAERQSKELETRRTAVLAEADQDLVQEIEELEEELEERRNELKEINNDLMKADRAVALAERELQDARHGLRAAVRKKVKASRGLRDQALADILQHVKPDPDHDLGKGINPYFGLRIKYARSPEAALQFFKEREAEHAEALKGIDTRILRAGNHARMKYDEYLREYGIERPMKESDPFMHDFHNLILQHNKLENNELRHYLEQAKAAEREMIFAIKEDLLTKLNAKFQKLDIQLRTLNQQLKKHKFTGGQLYKFGRRIEPSFDRIRKLAIQVGDNPDVAQAIVEGRTEDLDLQAGLEELEEFLESTDGKGLEDYRNYYTFDLYMISTADGEDDDGVDVDVVELRKRGVTSLSGRASVGSGGEGQAPFYVAIAASMALAYYPGGHPGPEPSGMGLVLFDEAFNKLDIQTTQALIKFFKDLGLQLLIAAPEDKRPTFSEVIDTIVSVNKDTATRTVYIASEFPKEKLRQELARRNPDHVGIEGYRKLIAEEGAANAAE